MTTSLRRSLDPELEQAVSQAIQQWADDATIDRIWAHDPKVWTDSGEQQWLGWLDVAAEQLQDADRFRFLLDDVRQAGFTDAVVLGMGGSSLCPEVLALTFGPAGDAPRLHVLDSTDPVQIAALEADLHLATTLFFVSSKSGSTLEPNIFAAYFFGRMQEVVGADAPKHFIAITDPGSKVEQQATAEGYRAVFHGLPSIGGRYSALSDFGMIPGAAAGVDVTALLDRGRSAAQECKSVTADNPGLQLGAVLGVAATRGRDKVTIVATSGLLHFGAWLEQLLAESTGKLGHGIVPVDREPIAAPESYGDDRVFAYLKLSSDSDPNLDAQVAALEGAGHAVVTITFGDELDLGYEIYRWEFATAVAGAIIGIDPFDQPDVEAAKIATRSLTDAYEQQGSLPDLDWLYEDEVMRLTADERNLAELKGSEEHSEIGYLRRHLERIQPGDYLALLAYLPMTEQHHAILDEIRVVVRDRLKVATCLGFGPRFQHSTGQAYKGGPNSGVFLQITCEDKDDLAIPGHSYSFGIVKEAQARGDFTALAAKDRRALRVDLGDDPQRGLLALLDVVKAALA